MYVDIEGPLGMLSNQKRKGLRSGKDCNKWRKGYVMYADFESTLEPERCPVTLHLGSMVAFKPAVAVTYKTAGVMRHLTCMTVSALFQALRLRLLPNVCHRQGTCTLLV